MLKWLNDIAIFYNYPKEEFLSSCTTKLMLYFISVDDIIILTESMDFCSSGAMNLAIMTSSDCLWNSLTSA